MTKGRVRRHSIGLLVLVGAVAGGSPAWAQLIDRYFPSSIPGYADDPFVSVISRQQFQNLDSGIRIGDFKVSPTLSEGFGYNDNTLGVKGSASPQEETIGQLRIASDWERDSLAASFDVDDTRYPSEPVASTTSWDASLGGTLQVGRSTVDLGYTHLALFLSPTSLGSAGVTAPVPYSDDDVRIDDNLSSGRFTLIPSVDYQNVAFSQVNDSNTGSYGNLDHQIESGSLTSRYDFSTGRGAVLILRGAEAQYTPSFNGLRDDYTDISGFVGLDYNTADIFRYRILVGLERRSFRAAGFAAVTTPTAELDLVWTPTRLTTITTTFSRQIVDPSSPNVGNEVFTDGRLQIDHELRRQIILEGFVDAGTATYDASPMTAASGPPSNQSQTTLGASIIWNLNRHLRSTLSYDHLNNSYDNNEAGQQTRFSNSMPTTNVLFLKFSLFN